MDERNVDKLYGSMLALLTQLANKIKG